MNQDHLAQDLNKVFKQTLFVFSSVIVNLFILGMIGEAIRFRLKPFTGLTRVENPVMLRYFFYAAGIVVIILLRALQKPLAGRTEGKPPQEVFRRLSRASLITAVLCEGPGLFGFILFLLTGLHRDFIILLVISLFLSFMYFPRKRAWAERLRQSGQAGSNF